MNNGTLERKGATKDHPPERKAKLKRGRMSEGAELEPDQIERIDALPADASPDAIMAAMKGTGPKLRQVKIKYGEDVKAAHQRALKLTGTPDEGGPKYPLTVKQTDAVKRALASKNKHVAEVNADLEKVSNAALRKIAKGQEAPKAAVTDVRTFLKCHSALRDDRTMYARKGAAIVLALREG
jgi:hypothetical protein